MNRVAMRFRGNGQYLCAEPPFVIGRGKDVVSFGGSWSSVDRLKDATTWASRGGAEVRAGFLGLRLQQWEIVPC